MESQMRNLLGEGELGGDAHRHCGQISAVIVRSSGSLRHGKSEQTPAPGSIEMKPQWPKGAPKTLASDLFSRRLIAIRLNTKKLYTAPADQGSVRDNI